MTDASNVKFVGVDWAIKGWFAIGFDEAGDYDMAHGSFRSIVDRYSSASMILVDIPIGLPQGEYERRDCDREAGDYVRNRRSSVFWTPPRGIVEEARRAKAAGATPSEYKNVLRRINEARRKGTKFSAQAWNITPMIAEVDDVLRNREESQRGDIREVHPEVCIRALGRGSAIEPKKVKGRINPAGIDQRIRILEEFEPRAREISARACATYARRAAQDDILDALAAAVTARLGYPDNLKTLPAKPSKDEHGLRMEMVFYNPPS